MGVEGNAPSSLPYQGSVITSLLHSLHGPERTRTSVDLSVIAFTAQRHCRSCHRPKRTLPSRDSNPDCQSQNLASYRWTTRYYHYTSEREESNLLNPFLDILRIRQVPTPFEPHSVYYYMGPAGVEPAMAFRPTRLQRVALPIVLRPRIDLGGRT